MKKCKTDHINLCEQDMSTLFYDEDLLLNFSRKRNA